MNNKNKGILFSLSAAFFFACMSASIKLAGDIPSVEKALFRNLVACIIAFTLAKKNNSILFGKKENFKILFFRSLFGTLGIVTNYYAIDHLILSDANILNKLSPFFAIIFSYLFLKEKITKVQLAALIVALTGALFVIKPAFNSSIIPSFIGVSSGLFAGIAYTFVRYLGEKEDGNTIVFFFSFFSIVVLIPFVIVNFVPFTLKQFIFLILAGIFAAIAQFSITAAYKNAAAKDISIYDYSQIIFSSIIGFLVFYQMPDLFSFLGYILIFSSSLSVFIINRKKVT